MKKIIDPFSYSVGHGALGLSCADCMYYEFNADPINRWCKLHKSSLNVMVDENGYLSGEWFCKSYVDNGAHEIGKNEFESIREELEEDILYQACQEKYLSMLSFDEIAKTS